MTPSQTLVQSEDGKSIKKEEEEKLNNILLFSSSQRKPLLKLCNECQSFSGWHLTD